MRNVRYNYFSLNSPNIIMNKPRNNLDHFSKFLYLINILKYTYNKDLYLIIFII